MRIVVKVGTSTLAYPTGRLNIRHAEELVKVLSDLKNEGHQVILVSSGAAQPQQYHNPDVDRQVDQRPKHRGHPGG